MYTKSGRSLWPAVVGALVVLVVVLVVLLVLAIRGQDPRDPGATATPEPEPTETATHEGQPGEDHGAELDAAPTGCLAGPSTDADMLLATQARAPHTAYGAVEVAASMMRWANQYPWPSGPQIASVEAGILSDAMSDDMADLAAGFAFRESSPELREDTPPGPAPFGTPFTTSTRGGLWVVDPTSTDDRVTVHLSLGVVVDGALSAERYGMGSPVLVWEDDAWRVVDTIPTDTAALEAGGVEFTGGC
ncbi:hypothetical protein [Cellulosimicrobium sp. NPDC057862]|uniref:hypothetical protein n=1 Tax=Actinomycetes TaxID=1760 RepID=UPI00366FBB5A